MGRILERMKLQTLIKFEDEKFHSDLLQELDKDGLGFKIKRENGKTLIYNVSTGFEFKD